MEVSKKYKRLKIRPIFYTCVFLGFAWLCIAYLNVAIVSSSKFYWFFTKILIHEENNDAERAACFDIYYNKSTWISERWATLPLTDHSNLTVNDAYYDPRDNSTIRILAILPEGNLNDVRKYLKCHLIFNGTHSFKTETSLKRYQQPSLKRSNGKFVIVTIKCEVPPDKLPCAVAVDCKDKTTGKIPVIYPYKPEKRDLIGVCVSVLYGYFDDREARALVEWFEINLMFGVSEFNFYNSGIKCSAIVQRVLDYYKDLGVLKITWFPPLIPQTPDSEIYQAIYYLKRPSINDCLIRNMYRYSAALVIDTDELLVPPQGFNYSMFTQLKHQKKTIHSIVFNRNAVYLDLSKSLVGPNDTKSGLMTELYQKYIPDDINKNYYWLKKSIIFPDRCIYSQNHYCMEPVKEFPVQYKAINSHVYHFRRQCKAGYITKNVTSGRVQQHSIEKKYRSLKCDLDKLIFLKKSLQSEIVQYLPEIRERTDDVFNTLDLHDAPFYTYEH